MLLPRCCYLGCQLTGSFAVAFVNSVMVSEVFFHLCVFCGQKSEKIAIFWLRKNSTLLKSFFSGHFNAFQKHFPVYFQWFIPLFSSCKSKTQNLFLRNCKILLHFFCFFTRKFFLWIWEKKRKWSVTNWFYSSSKKIDKTSFQFTFQKMLHESAKKQRVHQQTKIFRKMIKKDRHFPRTTRIFFRAVLADLWHISYKKWFRWQMCS